MGTSDFIRCPSCVLEIPDFTGFNVCTLDELVEMPYLVLVNLPQPDCMGPVVVGFPVQPTKVLVKVVLPVVVYVVNLFKISGVGNERLCNQTVDIPVNHALLLFQVKTNLDISRVLVHRRGQDSNGSSPVVVH